MNRNELHVIYGSTPKTMVQQVLGDLAIEREIPADARIGIKPNLVVAKPATSGATTTPELVAGVIEYLQAKGFQNVVILEGSWVGDRTATAFKVCGYEALSHQYHVPLIDLQKDQAQVLTAEGMSIAVCRQALQIDYLINMPVLKGHCQTLLTCALKNMKGCIPDSEKRKFHTMGLHKPIAHLNAVIKQDLIIVDGLMGDLNFEEGGNPVQMNRVIVGKDPVLVDAYAAALLGYELSEIPYLQIAADLGIGSHDLTAARIVELNQDQYQYRPALPRSRKVQQLARHIRENEACSACYGSLIHALDRLDRRGLLQELPEPVQIGQGYKGLCHQGIGVGICTNGATHHVGGCPPKGQEIVGMLEALITEKR